MTRCKTDRNDYELSRKHQTYQLHTFGRALEDRLQSIQCLPKFPTLSLPCMEAIPCTVDVIPIHIIIHPSQGEFGINPEAATDAGRINGRRLFGWQDESNGGDGKELHQARAIKDV